MYRTWRNTLGLASLAIWCCMAPAWSAPTSSADAPTPQGESTQVHRSAQSSPSPGHSTHDARTSTGDKGMDVLLQAKLPSAPLELNTGHGPKGFADPLATRPAQSGSAPNASGAPGTADNSGQALKQWVKEIGGASGEGGASARPSRDESGQERGTGANRTADSGGQSGDAQPSGFGRAIAFIRENRLVMLLLCAVVLILAGAALVYSSKASSGGHR